PPDPARVLLHPPGVPGEERHGEEDHRRRDEVGAEIEQGAGEETDADAHGEARRQPEGASHRHPPEVLGAPILSRYVYTSPSRSEASKASRRVTRKVAPIVGSCRSYSARIRPL